MDLNHRSPGYEPDGISRLPHLANRWATVHCFECTDKRRLVKIAYFHLFDEHEASTPNHASELNPTLVVACNVDFMRSIGMLRRRRREQE